MKSKMRWIVVGALAFLGLFAEVERVTIAQNLEKEEEKCGGYLKKCDTNENGKITCAEARKCGLKTPTKKEHPAYACMTDRDKDGVVCE